MGPVNGSAYVLLNHPVRNDNITILDTSVLIRTFLYPKGFNVMKIQIGTRVHAVMCE